ncbi:hypothetical protein [Rubrivirga marina]|uniref:Peptidase C-terminal archaeal/bacterial domain-containing protein n=1 Tax=Rubrivirga marina TaxID=1196024 RepID=A0A271J1I0_9BACT|nr:hypothetical protein [Rubrivirga marina]PAP77352.1 hypothetical protein BSZ37_13365 [Rubrivirga marina]
MRRPSLLFAAVLLAACGGASDDAPPADAIAPADTAGPETTRHGGSLEDGDETLQTGEYLERFEVVARAGQWIRAEVVSGDFDPYLLILSPSGEQTDVDDSVEGNTSMTEAVLAVAEGGEWTVVVTTYEPGETGDFDLTIEVWDEQPPGAVPTETPADTTSTV